MAKNNNTILSQVREGINDMCYIWKEEMKLTVRDEGVLIFFILVPILYPLLYSWVYNNELIRDTPVAVVDMSHSKTSRELIRELDATPDIDVAYSATSIEDAKTLMAKEKTYGTIYFPEDFETKLFRKEQAHLSLFLDMSYMLYYKGIYMATNKVIGDYNSDIQLSMSKNFTNRDDEMTTNPMKVSSVPIFNTTGGYGNFIIPGVLMLVIQQTLLLGIGLQAGTERERNKFHDLVPISRHYNGVLRIVLGKSMCFFMIYAIMTAWVTGIVPNIFNFIHLVHPLDLTLFMIKVAVALIFFAMCLSCRMKYRENVIMLVVFTSVVFLFASGVSWPQSNIPTFWNIMAGIIPSTWGIRGFIRMNSMGAELGDVLPEYHALWIQVFVYFFITCILYRQQIILSRKHVLKRYNMMKIRNKVSEKNDEDIENDHYSDNQ